jgi:arylsulfatase
LLREYGYTTGHFGKHHVGDRDRHLPTNHGFDEFFGSLYDKTGEDLPNARGVIRSYVNGRIIDTGPLTEPRIETLDSETVAATIDFIDRAHAENKPFYVWWNGTRTAAAADAMSEHDGHVGELLAKLDELGIAENTIVHYSSDGGLETNETRSASIFPFANTAGSAAESNSRVPSIVRWPGKIAADSISNEIMTHLDWLPTLLGIAGAENVKERLSKDGVRAGGRRYKVHLDGYDFGPYLVGSQSAGPRSEVLYFDSTGALVALRYDKWKGTFLFSNEDEASSSTVQVTNLRSNPYEHATADDELTDSANAAALLAPAEGYVGQLLATFEDFPPRDAGSTASVEAVMQMLSQPSP